MAKATNESVMTLSDKLHRRWTREFAGKPRHTRDLRELEHLIEKAAGLAKKAKQLKGDKGEAAAKVARERLELYVSERDAIAEAQFDRPEIGQIHAAGQAVERALAVWRRHFAGRDRRSRDLGLLEPAIASLAAGLTQLESFKDHPEVNSDHLPGLFGQLELMRDERAQIEKLRREMTPEDRAVAGLAEAQSAIDRYRVLFAGQPRTTTRVEVLDTIIGSLERCREALLAVGEAQQQNLHVVDTNLAAYRAERAQIIEAYAKAQPRDLSNQLGAAANQMFGLYREHFAGKERVSRDLKLLSDMCDRLTDLAVQMAAHDKRHAETMNRKNLALVDEQVRRFESEWVEIGKAKAEQAPKAAATQPASGPQITIAPKKG